jgi:hypothetical protein
MVARLIPNGHITIYNKYIAIRAEVYQRSEVYDVVWQSSDAISRMKEQVAANSALIMIPFARGLEYLAPKAWQALTDKSDNWTLQDGDVIVRGIVTDEIAGAFTIKDLYTAYDDVLAIASVAAMDEGSLNVRHWEVNCK